MKSVLTSLTHLFAAGVLLCGECIAAPAEQPEGGAAESVTRRVHFELTFSNRDLTWLGDPGSPTSSAYVASTARPVATDCCVIANATSTGSNNRRYFREARIVDDGKTRQVLAYTAEREKLIGAIDERGMFTPNDYYHAKHDMISSWPRDAAQLIYDPTEKALYREVDVPGPVVTESLDFLPLQVMDNEGKLATGRYSIVYRSPADDGEPDIESVALVLQDGDVAIVVAQAAMSKVVSRADMQIGSFDNVMGTYVQEADYRTEAIKGEGSPSVTITLRGEFSPTIKADGRELVYEGSLSPAAKAQPAKIVIDGDFDDWRNVTGVDDVRGDLVSYLDYVPDVDLLECKVAHDDRRLYLCARVVGQVGRTHVDGGRSYFYAYLDVDRNAGTGFIPSRDDECYYGVDLGDDCEVQFEFVGNRFRKSFYGFCGLGGDDNVLKHEVALGASQYGRFDAQGIERANYKSEYIFRGGVTEITEDLKLGTSDSIRVAISPDGREVEVSSTFDGFLKDRDGKPTVGPGQAIDLAVGMESDSKVYPGKTRWGADSTPVIRGYELKSSEQ